MQICLIIIIIIIIVIIIIIIIVLVIVISKASKVMPLVDASCLSFIVHWFVVVMGPSILHQ